jgi:hypothetical protein
MELVLVWIALSIAIGIGARRRYARNGLGWFLLALVISPLIAVAFLLAVGPKT